MKNYFYNHIKTIITAGWLFVLLCSVGQFSMVYASDFTVQGKLFFADDEVTEIAVNKIHVKTFKIGSEDISNAEIKKDGRGQVTFSIKLTDLNKNDQLLVVAEVEQEKGLFGGLSTVITEKELASGVIGSLTIYLNEIPAPQYEESLTKEIKICWKGMDDFSVVGYEVYRSEAINEEFLSVGRAGQTAGRQVCYTDNEIKDKVKYYYRLGVLNSWNAGTGKEVMISNSMSDISNGLMLGKGVVEDRKPKVKNDENDLTLQAVKAENQKESKMDEYLNLIRAEIEKRGWSYQMVLLVFIAIVLFLIIGFFVLSVEFSNIRSGGSGVWERRVAKSIFADKDENVKKKK